MGSSQATRWAENGAFYQRAAQAALSSCGSWAFGPIEPVAATGTTLQSMELLSVITCLACGYKALEPMPTEARLYVYN